MRNIVYIFVVELIKNKKIKKTFFHRKIQRAGSPIMNKRKRFMHVIWGSVLLEVVVIIPWPQKASIISVWKKLNVRLLKRSHRR